MLGAEGAVDNKTERAPAFMEQAFWRRLKKKNKYNSESKSIK